MEDQETNYFILNISDVSSQIMGTIGNFRKSVIRTARHAALGEVTRRKMSWTALLFVARERMFLVKKCLQLSLSVKPIA